MRKKGKGVAPTKGAAPWYRKVERVLRVLSRAILAAPVKLPAKVKTGAKYLVLLLGIVSSLEGLKKEEEEDDG